MDLKTQGIRFLLSGGFCAIIDFGLTQLCQFAFGFSPYQAKTVGFIFGTITAYLINRRWTFQSEPSKRRFIAVAVLYTVAFFVNIGLYNLCFRLGVHVNIQEKIASLIAFVIAQGVATTMNFVVQRMVIFKKS